MLSDYFDEYSLNARVRPSLLALLPPVLSIYVLFPKLYEEVVGLVGLLLVFGLVTALSHFVRYRGKIAEKKLYASWGGKPTTSMLRQSNTVIDKVTKQRYYDFFRENINGWFPPLPEIESRNSDEADVFYESAVRWLLEKTRDTKKYRLLFKENISYGFRRNCYGIKWYSVILSLASILILISDIAFPNFIEAQTNLDLSLTVVALSTVLLIWWTLLVNSGWVKDSSESYAIRLLSSCES